MLILLEKINLLLNRFATEPEVDSFRLLHGRGRCFAGLEFVNVDFFQPVLILTCYQQPPAFWLEELRLFLCDKLSPQLTCVLVQKRYLTGSPSDILLGELPQQVYAVRNNLRFHLHLNSQQNAGFFLDMESGRQWLEKHVQGKRVLNLFAYSCVFSVVAIVAGAEVVINVDMSSSALHLGRRNHQINGLAKERSLFLAENILKSWGRIKRRGPYDLVIIDPPSYQPGSFIAEKDYTKIIRRLPELMPQGGLVLACLNAPELSDGYLKDLFQEQLPDARFLERIIPHVDFPDVNMAQQLKLLVYLIPSHDTQLSA
jgi:23S rRNA (cytosine1962-C5)-methyltransferase